MKKIFLLLLFLLTACTISPSISHIIPTTTITSQSTGPKYPRLGIWWPNLYNQSLDKAARYDWVILGNWQMDFLGPLSELNPRMQLLISTNTCEVDFIPNNPSANSYLQVIPSEWYLTQVGTNLREDVDDSQTMLPVAAVKAGDIDLFIVGDTALIDDESVYIENVDATTLTLTVRRGYIRPVSAHTAGTRIAAHISFWPNSWMLNISTLSPKGVADPAIGPERWGDYNARVGAQLLVDSRWAGIFIDRAGQNQSRLIGNSTARSIDPDQSNRLVTDYSAFDTAWNEGLLLYLSKLRTAIGPDRIIFLNGGIPQYEAVNGSDFEGFPNIQDPHTWHTRMFGPNAEGGYFDWMTIARQPNLTTIETYEDNSPPNSNSTNRYNNCNNGTFIPNYRKMRFGLTSALLNDGYFSYAMSTSGSSCLLWFDEYDNAGSGRGYLGYPLGNAKQLITALKTPNQIQFGKFESSEDFSAWLTLSKQEMTATTNLDPSNPATGTFSARIDIMQTPDENLQTTFSYAPISVIEGKEYTLSFYARAKENRIISVWAEQDSEPWENRLNFGDFFLTKEWQKFELPAASETNDQQLRLVFGLGRDSGSVWLDEIALKEGNIDLWQRDYEHGIVIVNATGKTATIQLDNTYIKINGSQDRSVNDGSKVNKLDIAPFDGIILLRQK
jgi:hypothetical protein